MDGKATGPPSPAPYGANAAAYGNNTTWGPAPQPPPAGGCTYSRQELQDLLKESDYGQNYGAYNAYFTSDGTGGHLCRTCNRPLGQHPGAAMPQPTGVDADTINDASGTGGIDLPAPDVSVYAPSLLTDTTNGLGVRQLVLSRGVPCPRHWKGTAWFINFLEFDGFAGKHVEVAGSKKRRRLNTSVHMRWRCVAPNADHSGPCGATFVTKGVSLNERTLQPSKGAADMTIVGHAENSMHKHFSEVHQLETMPPGRWSTTLIGDYCQHPKAALSCCLFPMSTAVSVADEGGRGFCDALTASGPPPVSNQVAVAVIGPDEVQCNGACAFNAAVTGVCVAPLIVAGMAVLGALSVVTMLGIPCEEEFPVLLCCCCYARRRRFVKTLDIDESHVYTKLATFFCCPCSEVQQWRELRNSGVWAGLVCCTASDEDKAAMTPSAVRERYGVGGEYGVRAQPGAGHLARRTAALIDTFPGPKIAWSME